jgi:hypothetical protein
MIAARGLCLVALLFGFTAVADALRDHVVGVDSLRVAPTAAFGPHSRTQPLDSPKTQFRDALRWPVATTPAPRGEAVAVCSVPSHEWRVELDTVPHNQGLPFPVRPDHLLSSVLLI